MRLDGKVAFITGAGGGIGRAAVRLFASRGATVWMGDRDAGSMEELQAESPGLDLRALRVDVSDASVVSAAMETIGRESGRLDILYNNAGGTQPGDTGIAECDDAVFWSTIRVDLFGTWLCCKHAIALLAAGSAIVNTASIVGLIGFPRHPAYTAAKGGVAALTRSLAVAFAPRGIRVNAVAPGITRSARVERSIESGRIDAALQARHLTGFLECRQVAEKALFLACDASTGMTGQVLVADGGATIA